MPGAEISVSTRRAMGVRVQAKLHQAAEESTWQRSASSRAAESAGTLILSSWAATDICAEGMGAGLVRICNVLASMMCWCPRP